MRFYMYGTVEVAYDMILNLQTIRKRGGATLMMKSNCHTTKGAIKKTAIENVLLNADYIKKECQCTLLSLPSQ
jgi:hypothetical protein